MRDFRQEHLRRADDLSFDGWSVFCECKGQAEFVALTKKRALPVGSIYLWAIDEIWAPPASVNTGRAAA